MGSVLGYLNGINKIVWFGELILTEQKIININFTVCWLTTLLHFELQTTFRAASS